MFLIKKWFQKPSNIIDPTKFLLKNSYFQSEYFKIFLLSTKNKLGYTCNKILLDHFSPETFLWFNLQFYAK